MTENALPSHRRVDVALSGQEVSTFGWLPHLNGSARPPPCRIGCYHSHVGSVSL
jgi:hypothetical protein